jgi:hypothetical protein
MRKTSPTEKRPWLQPQTQYASAPPISMLVISDWPMLSHDSEFWFLIAASVHLLIAAP